MSAENSPIKNGPEVILASEDSLLWLQIGCNVKNLNFFGYDILISKGNLTE